jgi:hypothetical protein
MLSTARLYNLTAQKTMVFIVTAPRTLDFTQKFDVHNDFHDDGPEFDRFVQLGNVVLRKEIK